MIWSSLRRRKGRNILTVLAVGISFSLLVTLLSISYGIEGFADARRHSGVRDIIVTTDGLLPEIEDSHKMSEELAGEEEIDAALPLLTLVGRLGFPKKNFEPNDPWKDPLLSNIDTLEIPTETVGMVGIVPEMAESFMDDGDSLVIRSESIRFSGWFGDGTDPFFRSGYSDDWTGEMLLDRVLLDKYDVDIGSTVIYFDRSGEVRSGFVIVGVLETSLMGEGLSSDIVGGVAIVQLGELQYASGYHSVSTPGGNRTDLASAIYLDVSGASPSKSERDDIALSLMSRYQGLDVTTEDSRLSRIDEEIALLKVFSIATGSTGLIIGLVLLSTVLFMNVEERRMEIAVLKALGFSKWSIMKGVLGGNLLLSSAGALVGMVLAYAGSRYLDIYLRSYYGIDRPFTQFPLSLILYSMLILLTCIIVFSILPARRIIAIDISENLNG